MRRTIGPALFLMAVGCGDESGVNNGGVTLTVTMRASITAVGVEADAACETASVSGDGRLVAFASVARNLHGDDPDGSSDIYVKDMETKTLLLVSRATGESGTKGNGASTNPTISSDGKFVAFESLAGNLDPTNDPSTDADVYLRDLTTHQTILISRANGLSGAKGSRSSAPAYASGRPALSGDGKIVAFESNADNFGTSGTLTHIYVRDWTPGTTALISRGSRAAGAAGTGGSSTRPAVSDDGNVVAFQSDATNLVGLSDFGGLDTNAQTDVFARSWRAASPVTERVSLTSASGQVPASSGGCSNPSLSADGTRVSFQSASGSIVPGDTNGSQDVFVRDRSDNTTVLVSRHTSGSIGSAESPVSISPSSISGDGRRVAFDSRAKNLVDGDDNASDDIFLHDLSLGTTTRISVRTHGLEASAGVSGKSRISRDGHYVVFESEFQNLVEGDRNGKSDIFRRGPLP